MMCRLWSKAERERMKDDQLAEYFKRLTLILTQIHFIGPVRGRRILIQISAIGNEPDVGNQNEMRFVKFSI